MSKNEVSETAESIAEKFVNRAISFESQYGVNSYSYSFLADSLLLATNLAHLRNLPEHDTAVHFLRLYREHVKATK